MLFGTLVAIWLLSGCLVPPPPASGEPFVEITPPPDMTAVEWTPVGWALPSDWHEGGDFYTHVWEDETGKTRASADVFTTMDCPSQATPEPLDSGITDRATLSSTEPLMAPGAAGGWRYDLTGDPEGPRTELHVWRTNCEEEFWLTLFADDETVDRIAETIVVQHEK